MRRSLRETLAIGTLVISLLSSRANAHDFVVDQQAVDFTFYNVVVSLRSGVIGQSFVPQHGSLDVVELHLSNREALMPFPVRVAVRIRAWPSGLIIGTSDEVELPYPGARRRTAF